MPYKRKYKKKTYRKKKSNWNRTSGSGLTNSLPLSKTFKFKTRYVENAISLDPGVGGIPASYVFSLNGLYDPNITGTGHQPLGFDQMMTMYDHYTVIGARVRVNSMNNDLSTAQILCLQVKDTLSTSTDLNNVIENSMNRYAILAPSGTGGASKTMTINFSTKKFFSKTGLVGDVAYRGGVGSNPDEQAYLHILAGPVNGNDTSDVRVMVDIEYLAILSEPKQLASS